MSLLRLPVRRTLATSIRSSVTIQAAVHTIQRPTWVPTPVASRQTFRRGFSSTSTEPSAPATPPPTPVLSPSSPSPASSSATSDTEPTSPSLTASSLTTISSETSTSTSPPQLSPSRPRSKSSPPSAPSHPGPQKVPQGYRGPDRKPTRIRAPLPPYTPSPPPNLPFHVSRSNFNNLPVYLVKKGGGTRRETRIRGVRGDLKVLAENLSEHLGVPLDSRKEGVWVMYESGKVMIKGDHVIEVEKYLAQLGF